MSKSMKKFNDFMILHHQGGANMVDNTHKAIVIIATLNTVKAFSVSPEQYEMVNDVYANPTNYPVLNGELRAIYREAIASMTASHSDEEFDKLLTTTTKHFGKLYDGLVE